MKTTTSSSAENSTKKELKEAFVLWKQDSKSGTPYLSGFVSDENKAKLKGFFNTNKKNPNEPDIRVYSLLENGDLSKEVVASIWENVSKNNVKYLTGTTNENERLVCFYGKENEEKRPYIRAYYSE